jgi:hypothetical protein
VNDKGEVIAGALRAIADEAASPGAMADAAWRAGRRRRHAMTALSAAGAVVVVAAAVLLSLAAAAPGHVRPGVPAASPGMTAPVHLGSPIQFRQVSKIDEAACPAGSHGVPGIGGIPSCYHLTSTGLTISELQTAGVSPIAPSDFAVYIRLMPADTPRFAALTGKLAGLPNPLCQIAIIAGGRVVAAPVADAATYNGMVQIAGNFTTRAQAARFLLGLRLE